MCSSTKKKEDNIPITCRFWRSLSKSLPQIQIFGLDVSLTIATALFLSFFRLTVQHFVLVHIFGWPVGHENLVTAAGSATSILHSINLVPALGQCFASHYYRPTESLTDAPLWWQESVTALLQFCTGYMLYDGIFIIMFTTSNLSWADYMFLGHHVATVVYMTSTRLTQAGHQTAMMCMFLGELTNPFHNGHYIAQAATCCFDGPVSQVLSAIVEFCFCSSYCVVRALIAPVVFAHMNWKMWSQRNSKNSIVLTIFWTLLIWGVMFGSIPWVVDCWYRLIKYLPDRLVQVLPETWVVSSGAGIDEL